MSSGNDGSCCGHVHLGVARKERAIQIKEEGRETMQMGIKEMRHLKIYRGNSSALICTHFEHMHSFHGFDLALSTEADSELLGT